MKRAICWGFLLLSSGGSIGCVDTPQALLRDAITFGNEYGDVLMRANDEESALPLKAKLELFKKKWEGLNDRAKMMKDLTAKQKTEAAEFLLRNLDEFVEAGLRITEAIDRLQEIRVQLFLQEYAQRRDAGVAPRFIDASLYGALIRRHAECLRGATPVKARALQSEVAKETARTLGQSPVILLILDRDNELADRRPGVLFINPGLYQAYINDQPIAGGTVWPLPLFVSKEAFDAAKGGTQSDADILDGLYRNSARQSLTFVDSALVDKASANVKTDDKQVIVGKDVWPGLTALIESPKTFDASTLWPENPLGQKAPGADVVIPGLPPPPKVGP